MIKLRFFLIGIALWFGTTQPLSARKVNITPNIPYVDVDINGKIIRIERIQNTNHKLTNDFTKTSRPTPPFYIQPFRPIKGIKTVGELDVIDFIRDRVSQNEGILIDARMPKWYQNGTIPTALNLPFSMLNPQTDPTLIAQVMDILDVSKEDSKWDFSDAQTLLIFDNGPWGVQAVALMQNLITLGYPKSKISYYRGGIQFWQILGLTSYLPKEHK